MVTDTKDRMLHYLPEFLSNLREMREIITVEAPEFSQSSNHIEETLNQMFISTATWGLDRWERIANLPYDSTLSIEDRRIRLINHFSGGYSPSYLSIESIVNSYLREESASVTTPDEAYVIKTGFNFESFNWSSLYKNLKEILPAHLHLTINPVIKRDIDLTHHAYLNYDQFWLLQDYELGIPLRKDFHEVIL